MAKKQEEKYKIVDIKPDKEDEGDIVFSVLVLETDDGFTLNCDSDFPDDPLGCMKKEELMNYKTKFLTGYLVFLPHVDSLKMSEKKERKFEQKEGTCETEITGEVKVSETRNNEVHFDVDCGKFTFSMDSRKSDFSPKVGDSVYAKGDLRIEDIEIEPIKGAAAGEIGKEI